MPVPARLPDSAVYAGQEMHGADASRDLDGAGMVEGCEEMNDNRYACLNVAFAAKRRLNNIKNSNVTFDQEEIDALNDALISTENLIKTFQNKFNIVKGSEDKTQGISISDPRFIQKINPWNSKTGQWQNNPPNLNLANEVRK